MRADIIEQMQASAPQHSGEWYKARLGAFTGSQVGRLMKTPRKGAEWSADALTYIKEVAGERMINPIVLAVPDLFDQFLDFTVATSRAMAWGNEKESEAIKMFGDSHGLTFARCGSLPHDSLTCFRDSPDGICLEADATIDVKCPSIKVHTSYIMELHTPADLQRVSPEYYWQCMSHMAVTGASICYWASYNPFVSPALWCLKFERDSTEEMLLLSTISRANNMVEKLCTK